MNREMMIRWQASMVVGLAVLLAVGCTSGDEVDPNVPAPTVSVQLNFSLPSRIVGRQVLKTRMSSDIVQAGGTEAEFRGIDDVHLFCFDSQPTATSTNIGNVIEMKTAGDEMNDSVTRDDYSLSQEISIPIGTSHFAFYGRAADSPQTHEERMRYGIIETVGLGQRTYEGNSAIRFRPVQICTSEDPLGDSPYGQALLNLLNSLANIRVNEQAPNDQWPTANSLYLDEAWQRMKELTTLSSRNVQSMLGKVLMVVSQEGPDGQGNKLAEAIAQMIIENCDPAVEPDIEHGIIVLKSAYQGFPADLHLPEGSARIRWDQDLLRFVVADKQDYGDDFSVSTVGDYVYPMNLQYQIFSDIVVSDTLVINAGTETSSADGTPYDSWSDLINYGYSREQTVVTPSTHSVAMVKQVQYAVGRLELYTRLGATSLPDAAGHVVSVDNTTFTLKGYLVGSQCEVDYDFQPVADSPAFAIYDTDLNGGSQSLQWGAYTEPDYILGLGTMPNASIQLALELQNNGAPFQGLDGVIETGATFYLVANANPLLGQNYDVGSNDQIFCKDRGTKVFLTIKRLDTATYGLPDLQIPRPTLGVSVDIAWSDGFWFDAPL